MTPKQGVPDPYVAFRSYGGHHSKDGSSTIDGCRKDERITRRLRAILTR